MDISHADRGASARAAYQKDSATARDSALIANVLRRTEPGTAQSLALGAICPYDASQRRERAAWIAEIRRQRGEGEAE